MQLRSLLPQPGQPIAIDDAPTGKDGLHGCEAGHLAAIEKAEGKGLGHTEAREIEVHLHQVSVGAHDHAARIDGGEVACEGLFRRFGSRLPVEATVAEREAVFCPQAEAFVKRIGALRRSAERGREAEDGEYALPSEGAVLGVHI